MKKTTLLTSLALLIFNTQLIADYYSTSENTYNIPGQTYSAMQINTVNSYTLPQQTIKLRIDYNTKKLTLIEKVLADKTQEVTLWTERLYQVKHELLFDKYLLQNPNANPNTNNNYLNEKLSLQQDELELYKSKITNIKLSQDETEFLRLKILDISGALEITSALQEQPSTQQVQSYTKKPNTMTENITNMVPKSKKKENKPVYGTDHEGFADWE